MIEQNIRINIPYLLRHDSSLATANEGFDPQEWHEMRVGEGILTYVPKPEQVDAFYEAWSRADFSKQNKLLLTFGQQYDTSLSERANLETQYYQAVVYVHMMLAYVAQSGLYNAQQVQDMREIVFGHGLSAANFAHQVLLLHPDWLDGESMFSVTLAMLLHDIGKYSELRIFQEGDRPPDDVLARHTLDGYSWIRNWELGCETNFPSIVRNFALRHHKFKNGKGYPQKQSIAHGKHGELSMDIAVAADGRRPVQIMQMADELSAMLDPDRTYGKIKTSLEALAVLVYEADEGKFDEQLMADLLGDWPFLLEHWHLESYTRTQALAVDPTELLSWNPATVRSKLNNDSKSILDMTQDEIWDVYVETFANVSRQVSDVQKQYPNRTDDLVGAFALGDSLAQVTMDCCLVNREIFSMYGVSDRKSLEHFLHASLALFVLEVQQFASYGMEPQDGAELMAEWSEVIAQMPAELGYGMRLVTEFFINGFDDTLLQMAAQGISDNRQTYLVSTQLAQKLLAILPQVGMRLDRQRFPDLPPILEITFNK